PAIATIPGCKYTTYRVMAADAINAAVEDLGESEVPASTTDQIPLVGAIGFADVWADRSSLAERWGLTLDQTERLLRRHGSRVSEIFDLIADDPSLAQPLVAGHPYLRAEALVAVTHQGVSLSDVLVRRLRITPESVDGGRAAAEAALPLIAGPLGWDAARADKELEAYLSHGMQHAPAS
ncbi:MAG: glycerol-3-phosphate dehydrogenase C-terminal domain-containing protein, partial [Actinomycetota bacterium]